MTEVIASEEKRQQRNVNKERQNQGAAIAPSFSIIAYLQDDGPTLNIYDYQFDYQKDTARKMQRAYRIHLLQLLCPRHFSRPPLTDTEDLGLNISIPIGLP